MSFVQHVQFLWLANVNIKRNVTSMFVNKKYRYSKLHEKNHDYLLILYKKNNFEINYHNNAEATHAYHVSRITFLSFAPMFVNKKRYFMFTNIDVTFDWLAVSFFNH